MKSIIFFIMMSLFASYANADEISHRAAAEELILLSNPDQMLQQAWSQVAGMVDQQFQQMGAPEKAKPILKKYTDRMFKVMEEELSFASMKDDMIAVYVKTYTESEIRAISDFYKSPAGKALLEKMPQLVQESIVITQKKIPPMMEKIQAISEEMSRELKNLEEQQQNL